MDKLFYLKPAKYWRHALPLGNGLLGVMAYGGKTTEKLSFNDVNLWSGYPKNQDNPQSLENLEKVRQLIFDGKQPEAQKLMEEKFIGEYSEAFLPLGDIYIKIDKTKKFNYMRELNIGNAVFTCTHGQCKREAFASYPDKVFVYQITNKTPFDIKLYGDSQLRYQLDIHGDNFNILGNAPDYVAPNYDHGEPTPVQYDKNKGMSFCLSAKVVSDGNITNNGKALFVSDATVVTIYFTTATGFLQYDKMPETSKDYALNKCQEVLTNLSYDYEQIKNNHIQDYKNIYDKQSLSLNSDVNLPTDKLLRLAKAKIPHNGLIELIYNYGKYMMISASRKGGNPTTLQGIWNKDLRPAWSSNYTININTEMNYWGMSQCNLHECAEPLINFVYEIMQHGKSTAKVNYGCSGFACNHNVDLWRKTTPVKGDSNYMYAPLCGVWLTNEIYEHLRYGNLDEYKDKIQEITTEAVKFVCDYLVLHNGEYVTCPSTSPEASFVANGKKCDVDFASSFELGLIRQLFQNFKEFSTDTALLSNVEEKLSKLKPFTCGETGINEWSKYYEMPEKGHRHFSPNYAFYPARVIGYYKNPQEREWVRQLFHHRVDHSRGFIGWSSAWAICQAARLREADRAKMIINKMLASSFFSNLFDTHPPQLFQIDGNYGFLSAINELLLTEEDGVVELLPALPKEFACGTMTNLRVATKNNITFSWENGLITSASADGEPLKVKKLHIAENAVLTNIQLVD